MGTNAVAGDCEHRSCRLLGRALALGRRPSGRCRRWCPAADTIVSLDQLGQGQTGRVLRIEGRAVARRRLVELGLVRGEVIRVQRAAPLGDPREYIVKGYHLSLRKRDAATITVEVLEAPAVISDAA